MNLHWREEFCTGVTLMERSTMAVVFFAHLPQMGWGWGTGETEIDRRLTTAAGKASHPTAGFSRHPVLIGCPPAG